MKNKQLVPITFVSVTAFLLALGTYVLAVKTTLHPQFFITTCGEILKDVSEHVHFNPDGIVSSVLVVTTALGVSLALWQVVRFVMSHRRLQRQQRVAILPASLKKIQTKYHLTSLSVQVVKSEQLVAYTTGLFKPKIIISQALVAKLSDDQLAAVVLHEVHHLRSKHLWWLLFSRLISSLFFFIPLVEYLAQQLRIEFELAADAFVVEQQQTKHHLCSSLALNLAYVDGVLPQFATSPIEKRVETLVGNKISFESIRPKQLGISLLSFGLMVGAAVFQPSQVVADITRTSSAICEVGDECQTTDCTNHASPETNNFSPLVPASMEQ